MDSNVCRAVLRRGNGMLGLKIIAPILSLYVRTFAASGLQIGLVFAAFSAPSAPLGPVVDRAISMFPTAGPSRC